MKRFGNNVSKLVFDLLFPIHCLGCRKEGQWLCDKCLATIKLNTYFACPICETPNLDGRVCGYCQKQCFLDGLIIIVENNTLIKEVVHYLKYNFTTAVLADLQPVLTKYFLENPFWRDSYVLVPIPLHRRRFLERGFNQSQLIAKAIADCRKNQINNLLLKRIKYSHTQVKSSALGRRTNIIDGFRIKKIDFEIFNQRIFLIDDVYTTGSTMNECAKELKKAGYKNVWGLALIRG